MGWCLKQNPVIDPRKAPCRRDGLMKVVGSIASHFPVSSSHNQHFRPSWKLPACMLFPSPVGNKPVYETILKHFGLRKLHGKLRKATYRFDLNTVLFLTEWLTNSSFSLHIPYYVVKHWWPCIRLQQEKPPRHCEPKVQGSTMEYYPLGTAKWVAVVAG